MCWESSDVVGFDLGPLLQGQTSIAKLKSVVFGVVGFDLGPLLQGQTRIAKLKSAYNSLIICPRGLRWYTNI